MYIYIYIYSVLPPHAYVFHAYTRIVSVKASKYLAYHSYVHTKRRAKKTKKIKLPSKYSVCSTLLWHRASAKLCAPVSLILLLLSPICACLREYVSMLMCYLCAYAGMHVMCIFVCEYVCACVCTNACVRVFLRICVYLMYVYICSEPCTSSCCCYSANSTLSL